MPNVVASGQTNAEIWRFFHGGRCHLGFTNFHNFNCRKASEVTHCIIDAGRPRPWSYCVRWGTSSPSPKVKVPQFSAHVYCAQMAGWIKMPVGMEVGLDPSDTVLDGDPAPLPKKRSEPPIFVPCILWPYGCMDQDATW